MSEKLTKNIDKVKIILVGESGVGKTSIVSCFMHQKFDDSNQPTLGACYISKQLEVNNGKKLQFQIWDTAGQQRYRSIAPIYYKQAQVALCVYDITSANSFQAMKRWVNDIKVNGPANIKIMIVGNKIDKCQKQQIDYQTAKQYASSIRSTLKIVSAKQNKNIQQLFIVAGEMAEKRQQIKSSFILSSQKGNQNWMKKVFKYLCWRN